MGYKIQFETGHTVEFDTKPSDADIEEAYNHVKGTPATAAKPKLDPRALLQDTTKQAQDYSANMYSGLEGAATAVTGGVAPLLAPIPAAMQYANEKLKGNSPSFEDLYANAMHGMTYEPKSDLGKSQAEVIGKFANDVLIPAATGAQGLPFVNTLGAYAGAVGRNLGRVKPVAKATETPHPALAAIEAATKPAEVAIEPPNWSTSPGARDTSIPPVERPPFPSPDYLETRPGAAPEVPQIPGIAPEGLVRSFDDPMVTTGNRKAPLEMEPVPGRPDLPDTMIAGRPGEIAATDAMNRAMLDPGAVEARRLQTEQAPVEQHPFVKAAVEKADKAQAKVDALEAKLEDGKVSGTAVISARKALEKAQETLDTVKTNIKQQRVKRDLSTIPISEWKAEELPTATQYKSMWSDVVKNASDEAILKRNEKAIADELKKTSAMNYAKLEDLANTQENLKALADLKAGQKFTTNLTKKKEQTKPKTKAAKEAEEWLKRFNGNDGITNMNSGIPLNWKTKEPLDQLKKVAGIRENLRHLFPEEITGEQLVEKLKDSGAKDVDQNLLQRGINHLTKGSLYQAIKTDNPVIKFVGEKFRAADNQIKRFTGELVHDLLAPMAQKLSKKEKADIWALQTVAEAKGFTLTPEFMKEHGYNEKQIQWVEGHKEVMAQMLERINTAQSIAGKAPISPRVAYLATRARGDFRKLVYDGLNPSGEPKVVGILGDNTRAGLNKQIEQLKAKHPEYTTGEERFYGGHNKKGTADGFEQLLEFLSENDPKMKDFVDRVNDLISDDAYNFMNAKTHTMNKKGIFGMEGKKLFEDAAKNAEDGMAAQIRYAETIIRWSELSKAVDEVKPVIAKDNGVNMPNAKAWAEDYIQGALGNSPGEFGKHLDNATAALGKSSGLGVTIPGQVMGGAKKLVNGMLLGFVNVGFNAMNMIQPVKTMPEMAMWLKTKGVDVGVDMGLGRALTTMQKDLVGMKLTDVETAALKYAKDNHVYSSSLFESGNRVSKDVPYYWDKGTQFIAKDVEAQTRKLTYLAYVHMLNESGIKPKDGLFQAAQNATDIHMNNYAQAEAPKIYQETGAVGRSAYNLMSFKHNELSRVAMLAREIPNTKEGRPLLVAIASQIAFAGVMGMIGYHEADALYQFVTSKMGSPTSITKLLLDNPEIPESLKYGIGSKVGLDLTNRMGVQVTPGSLVDAVAPGASKVGTMAKAAYQAVTQPNEYNAKNMVREFSPNSVQGIEDRAWFSGKNPMGEELSMNRNKVQANAVRNQTDKLWKTLGLTGVNESKQKTLDYENTRIDQVYKDKRKSIIDNAAKVMFTSGKVPADFARNYIKAQGDPNSLAREITTMAMEQNVDRPTLEKMRNAMSSSLTSMHKLLRETGKE